MISHVLTNLAEFVSNICQFYSFKQIQNYLADSREWMQSPYLYLFSSFSTVLSPGLMVSLSSRDDPGTDNRLLSRVDRQHISLSTSPSILTNFDGFEQVGFTLSPGSSSTFYCIDLISVVWGISRETVDQLNCVYQLFPCKSSFLKLS